MRTRKLETVLISRCISTGSVHAHLTGIDGRKYPFSHFEYSGSDFDADLQAVANSNACSSCPDLETRR